MSNAVSTHRPVVGVLWMLVTGAQFVAVTALVKHIGSRIPAAEAAFLRYVLGLVFLIPMIRPMLIAGFDRSTLLFFGWRGAAHSMGVMLWFFAIAHIPITEVTSMGYLAPVLVTIGAALFLGERFASRRLIAVLVALLGAMIILRPGIREISSGHLAMLGTAFFFAMSYLIAKLMADRVPPAVVVGWLSIFVAVGLAPFAYAVWIWPTWQEIGWLFLVATFATGGHFTMTLAFRAAPVSVTQPVTFLQLVWATLLGALVFVEPVDFWVIFGGGLIIASVSFIAWREAVLGRRSKTPPTIAA